MLDGAQTIRAPLSEDGREEVPSLVEPPQWFGGIACLGDSTRRHDAVGVAAGALWLCIARSAVDELPAADPRWWRELGRLPADKVRAVFSGHEDPAGLPARQRLARRLLTIAEGHGMLAPGLSRRNAAVSQEALGAVQSLSRQTARRCGAWKPRGRSVGAMARWNCSTLWRYDGSAPDPEPGAVADPLPDAGMDRPVPTRRLR